MHSLNEIIVINDRAAAKAVKVEDNHNRACSFQGDANNGIILHSAKFRNTVFLYPRQAKNFLRRWFSLNSDEAHNHLVESFFVGV